MKREYDLVVIGAGAAGMLCAGTAAEEGLSVLLLEKNGVKQEASYAGGRK